MVDEAGGEEEGEHTQGWSDQRREEKRAVQERERREQTEPSPAPRMIETNSETVA